MKFVIPFFIVLFQAYSLEINGKLTINSDSGNWMEGEVKQLEILVWPLEDVNRENLKTTLENKPYCDYFFLGNINSIEYSKNNPLALIIKADATLKKAFSKMNPIIWSYRALNIPMDISQINPISDPNKIQDFYVFDRKYDEKSFPYIIILGVAICFAFCLYLWVKYKEKNKRKRTTTNWKKLILKSNDRTSIEEIYKNKELIIYEIGGTTPVFENLFKTIDKHQYKQEWSADDLSEINFILDEIKESLK